jgi:uncharacterized damage-inducible protein DinB
MKDAILAEYDRETAVTRRVLQRVPSDRLEWRPHPRSTTFGGLGRHLAHNLTWGSLALSTEQADLRDRAPMAPTTTLDDILAVYDRNAAATRALIAARSDDELSQTWTLTHDGRPLFVSPRSDVIRTMVIHHMVHHRGQLTVYLRLNDVPVPSIYGPSADEG